MKEISETLKLKVKLIREQNKEEMIRIAVFYLYINKEKILKIDFVEDLLELVGPSSLLNTATPREKKGSLPGFVHLYAAGL